MKTKVSDSISAIKPYEAGKPLKEVEREYGISNAVKLASNENPLGPGEKVIAAINNELNDLSRYPDGNGFRGFSIGPDPRWSNL